MRILIYSVLNLSNGLGAERWIKHISTRLHARGHEITVVTTKYGKNHDPTIKISLLRNGIGVVELENYNFLKLPKVTRFAQFLSLLKSADVIYFNNAFAFNEILIYIFRRLTSSKVLVGYHGTFPESGCFFRRSYHRFVNRRVCKAFDGHHIQNGMREKLLNSWGYRNVTRVPNGVDTSILLPSKKYDKFTVMFAGSLIYQKGIDRLAGAIKLINSPKPNSEIEFIIYGSGEYSFLAKELEEKFSNVRYVGYAPTRDLHSAYAKSHVFVAPSRFEEFPLAILEALSSGTPVIASDIAGIKDIFLNDNTGFLINGEDESEISHFIIYLQNLWYNNRKEYERFSVEARLLALEYDWNIVADHLEEFLRYQAKSNDT